MLYGKSPRYVNHFKIELPEMMHYLYLPVVIYRSGIRLSPNVEVCRPLIEEALAWIDRSPNSYYKGSYNYVYLTARKGWASPDSPLNRPGWHCDGFGTNDLNFIWWSGPGTRFAIQAFKNISEDHIESLKQFEQQVRPEQIGYPPERILYALNSYVVHATPIIEPPGCMREFIKISFSNNRYNLRDNSHNYLFDYNWPMHSREMLRNDPSKAGQDFV
jgi:hypothetical protein